MNDRELVEACKRGDRDAFEQLYHRHKEWVAGLALRFCGSRDDALDVLQETFAYFYRKLPGFELRAQFRTFLYPVVKHLALRRKEKRLAPLTEAAPADEPKRSGHEELLEGLSGEQREVVWLRFVDGFNLQEIAETLDIPVGTVKSRLHKAMEILRNRKIL